MLGNTLRIEHQAEIDPERKTPQEPTTDQSMVLIDFPLTIVSESAADHPKSLENIFYGWGVILVALGQPYMAIYTTGSACHTHHDLSITMFI